MDHTSQKIIFILILLFSKGVSAFPDSTGFTIPTVIRFTDGKSDHTGGLYFYSIDTLLDEVQIFNPAIGNFYNDLGNIGSAADPKLFSLSNSILTRTGNTSFELYQYSPEKVRFYTTNKRYSNIDYHMSGGKEQHITLTMAQNIFPNWNAGFDFSRRGSLGFLNNGKTFITNFNFFTSFRLPNNRYHAFASATWNSIKNEVHGGLTDDSLYENNQFSNSELEGLKVGLINAEHMLRNHVFSLNHFYDLLVRKDSAENISPFMRLQHELEFERSSWNYDNNNSDTSYFQYHHFPGFKDSLHYDAWVNKISVETFFRFRNFKPVHRAALKITGGYQWFDYEQILSDTTMTNTFVEGSLRTSGIRNRSTLDVTAKYVLDGANKKDFFFRLKFKFPLLFGANMHIGLQSAIQSPALNYNLYVSNHYIWLNNFDKTTSHQFFFQVDVNKYNFSVGGTSTYIGRYLYYDNGAEPAQSRDSIQVSQLYIKKDFKLWKIRFNNTLWIQQTDNDVVRIPEYNSYHSLYYEDRFFKSRLSSQIGFDMHYSSFYFSNAYAPSTSVFYLQNEKETNGYALIDFFVNLKIKRARITLKLQNISDNIVAFNYANTPYHPQPGMVFQLGVKWRFFDD